MLILAQQSLELQDILQKLAPRGGVELLYDLLLYIVFFLGIIVMFMQGDKELLPTMLMALVAGLAVIAKLEIFAPKEFGSLVINAGMFALPLIVAGITKTKKSQAPAVITGVFGGIYFFLFWLVSQRGG
jgi:hypothetical protein